jgi:putative ABC transport system ATP-binding protein
LRIAGWGWRDRSRRTHEVLELVGISERANHRPYELSGGEQQRVAIARAIVHRPSLILADEPTGELDTNTGAVIFELLKGITQNEEVGIIVATHDVTSARIANKHLQISDGTFIN